jgi:S-adenosylmethionine:tRNA ribosyltransferase-isomerase
METHLKSLYSFDLPNELIAHHPLKNRDKCRLLSMHKEDGTLSHLKFFSILEEISPKSVIVINDTKVIHARIKVMRITGAKGEVFIQNQCEDGTFIAIVKPSKRIKENEKLVCLKNKDYHIHMHEYIGEGLWKVSIDPILNYPNQLNIVGDLPLPPYIERENGNIPSDEEDYQTVFSKNIGSVAAPTASLHFTEDLLKKLKDKGVEIVTLTHHVGMGTFHPIRVDNILEHTMHSESYTIPLDTSKLITAAKREGRSVIAVGTTVVRALESTAEKVLKNEEVNANTNLFIYPPYEFKIVDELITNFHLSQSSLLMLVSAFAGRDNVLTAYEEAVKNEYRFFSYGDAMYIHT